MSARRGRRTGIAAAIVPGGGVKPVLLMAAAAALAGCGGLPSGDAEAEADHTHAGGGNVTLWTDALELFVEYPPHVLDVPSDPWGIHLTWLDDWQDFSASQCSAF